MGELRDAFETALDGPQVETVYECAHCGTDHEELTDDCPDCGGVVMRIVTDDRDDTPRRAR